MRKTKENKNQNNFNGITNFNGTTQIAAGDIINNTTNVHMKKANYEPEPIWRSPFTMAVLSWISFIITIGGLFPINKIIKSVLDIYNGSLKTSSNLEIQTYTLVFAILVFLFVLVFSLRRITKNQTRYPLLFNFAISGYGERLTLEKIHIGKCPQCKGEMKYYNKPVEWRDILRSDGSNKREVTKRVPALECKRNAEHWYKVDPAEDKLK